MRFVRLLMLIFPGDLVDLIAAFQLRPGLVVIKRNAIFHTLHVHIQYPGIIADPGNALLEMLC